MGVDGSLNLRIHSCIVKSARRERGRGREGEGGREREGERERERGREGGRGREGEIEGEGIPSTGQRIQTRFPSWSLLAVTVCCIYNEERKKTKQRRKTKPYNIHN